MKLRPLIIIFTLLVALGLLAAILFRRSEELADNEISVVKVVSSANAGSLSINEITNKSGVEPKYEVDKIQTTSDQFFSEPRNSSWADETERTIARRLSQSSQIGKVVVSCKSTICQTTGEFEVSDPDQIDSILNQIRSAANFKGTDSSTSGVADNTTYSVVGLKPLRIKFSDHSRW